MSIKSPNYEGRFFTKSSLFWTIQGNVRAKKQYAAGAYENGLFWKLCGEMRFIWNIIYIIGRNAEPGSMWSICLNIYNRKKIYRHYKPVVKCPKVNKHEELKKDKKRCWQRVQGVIYYKSCRLTAGNKKNFFKKVWKNPWQWNTEVLSFECSA